MKNKSSIILAASILLLPQIGYAGQINGDNQDNASIIQSNTSITDTSNQSGGQPQGPSNSSKSIPSVTAPSEAPSVNQTSILDFSDVTFPDSIKKGQKVEVSFTLKNNGNVNAENIMIRADSKDLQGLVPKSVSQANPKSLSPQQTARYSFAFKANNASGKNYPIVISIAYNDGNTGRVHKTEQVVAIKIDKEHSINLPDLSNVDLSKLPLGKGSLSEGLLSGKPSSGVSLPSGVTSGAENLASMGPSLPITSSTMGGESSSANQGSNVPKIIIDEYSFDPSIVQAGTPFTLNLRIFNTNRKKTIKNIRVSLTADAATTSSPSGSSGGDFNLGSAVNLPQGGGEASAFIPVGSSNTFHIETIKPRKYHSKDLTLTTAPDLVAKAYTITANFEYEDSDGNPYQSSEIIGIPVTQKSEIQFGDLNIEKEGATVGVPLPLSLEFFNTGKTALTNVMVKVRGNFSADTSTYFAGTIEPGASDSYDVNITPDKAGKQKGEVVITYDDEAGMPQEKVEAFEIQVDKEMPVDEENIENTSNKPSWALPVGIGGLIILIGALAVYLWRKKKNDKNDDGDLQL